ncbi:MAG: hypothetical protein QOJ29_5235 [Thermoleophilaceae bacterium]|jgi:hypothetical protein|nr:hypothetical protein [Thermoleophilaceae bacterium]
MGYESWYLKASHPTEPLGVWIRYTTHQKPDGPERGSLWFVLFTESGPQAAKVTPGPEALSRGDGAFIRIGESTFEDGRVRGEALEAKWNLTFEHAEAELRHLPRAWMYKAPIPRTKLTSPYPAARFSGTVSFGEREVELDSWAGMIGHNWGSEHAERWIWLHGANLEGHGPDTWLDAAIGRIKIGPWTTPWIANGVLSLDGKRHTIGGIERARGTKIAEHPDRCTFTLPGPDITLKGEVGAPRERFVGWTYADPDGSEHNTVNCSIAQLSIDVQGAGSPTPLVTHFGAAYELGMRENDHGIPIQPFPDG